MRFTPRKSRQSDHEAVLATVPSEGLAEEKQKGESQHEPGPQPPRSTFVGMASCPDPPRTVTVDPATVDQAITMAEIEAQLTKTFGHDELGFR